MKGSCLTASTLTPDRHRVLACSLLAALVLPASGLAANVVLTNTPNGTTGGSTVTHSEFKSLIFTSNAAGGQIESISLGLNPAPLTSAPVTQNVRISLWSVSVVGSAYTPTTRLASTVLLPANITGAGGIFTFNQVGTNSLFRLSPDTTYGLTISSDAVGIRWSNTGSTGLGTAVSPTALLGYGYHTFRGSSDSGATWYVTPGVHNTVIMSVDSRIFAEHLAYASTPYDTGFNGGTLQVDVPGSFSQSYDTGTGGYLDGNGLNAVFTGMFSGAGDLSFINSAAGGAVTLAGTSTYTGATHVGANVTLRVNGSIAASSGLSIADGGVVGGNGRLPATSLMPGATLAPGNSIGTLTASSLALNGGTLAFEFQGALHDRLNVAGQISNFSGTAKLLSYGGGAPWPLLKYTLLTAPASTGFAGPGSLAIDQSALGSALLQQGATVVQELDGNPRTFDLQWRGRDGNGVAESAMRTLAQAHANQLATAGALDRTFAAVVGAGPRGGALIDNSGFTTGQAAAAGISPGLLSATSRLLALDTSEQLTAAVTSLAPEPWAAFQSVGLETLQRQRDTLLSGAGRCATGGGVMQTPGGAADKTGASPVCVFAGASDASSEIDGRDGLSDYDSHMLLSSFGLEYQPVQRWTVGAAFSHGNADLDHMPRSHAQIGADVNSLSAYGVYQPAAAWTFRSLVGYSHFDIDGSRQLAFIGDGTTLTARPDAEGYTVAFNGDYLLALPTATRTTTYLRPLVGVAWGAYQQGKVREGGSSGLNTTLDAHTAHSLTANLGLELSAAPIALSGLGTTTLTPRLTLAYQLDALADDAGTKTLRAAFVGSPAAGRLDVRGENRGLHGFTLDGGADLQIARNAALYATLGYEAFSTGAQFSCGGGVKLSF